MSFLQPLLLFGLPLALLPILIHLINQHRHRTVPWAATMFLLNARKLTRGIARLRQLLILAFRVLAVLTLLFAASRPLAGGWLGMAGGKADTILLLLDRSASMEMQNLETGESKRSTALARIGELIETTGGSTELVLIDSATLRPLPVTDIEALEDLPQAQPTATAASIPDLLSAGIEYLLTDESGRTDIWLASDLRQSDWNPSSGQWQTIRSELAPRDTVRLFLLTFPESAEGNLSVSVDQVRRLETPEGPRLVMDLYLRKSFAAEAAASGGGEPGATDFGSDSSEVTVPVEITINGTRTVEEMSFAGTELNQLGYSLPLGPGDSRGWGRISLPADDNPSDNDAFLVFDDPAVRRTIIYGDEDASTTAIRTAAEAPNDPSLAYEAEVFPAAEIAQIPWEETALLFWQAAIPEPESPEAALLRQHVENGRTLVLLPPEDDGGAELYGFRWQEWSSRQDAEGGAESFEVNWWRTESDLLADTRGGSPLPAGDLAFYRVRNFAGETQPLLRLESGAPVVTRLVSETPGAVYAWATLPGTEFSSLATEGIVFFAMVHRALDAGAGSIARARLTTTGPDALPDSDSMQTLATAAGEEALPEPGLVPAAFEWGLEEDSKRLLAVNRPVSEDAPATLAEDSLAGLLEGVNYRQIRDEVDSGDSLASEVWRAFLVGMALALLAEALLCLPPPPEKEGEGSTRLAA